MEVDAVEIISLRFVAGLDSGPCGHPIFYHSGVEGRGLRFGYQALGFLSHHPRLCGRVRQRISQWGEEGDEKENRHE